MMHKEAWWPALAPHLRLESYGHRDAGEFRLEVSPDIPRGTARSLLRARAKCPACGYEHRPFRLRAGGGGYYLAIACPDEVNPGCKRHERSRVALDTLIQVIKGNEPPADSPRLF